MFALSQMETRGNEYQTQETLYCTQVARKYRARKANRRKQWQHEKAGVQLESYPLEDFKLPTSVQTQDVTMHPTHSRRKLRLELGWLPKELGYKKVHGWQMMHPL
jgi:hypothetical protein